MRVPDESNVFGVTSSRVFCSSPSSRTSSRPRLPLMGSRHVHSVAILRDLDEISHDTFPVSSHQFPPSRGLLASLADMEVAIEEDQMESYEQFDPNDPYFVDVDPTQFARIMGPSELRDSSFRPAGTADKTNASSSHASDPFFPLLPSRSSSVSDSLSARSSHALGLGISHFLGTAFHTIAPIVIPRCSVTPRSCCVAGTSMLELPPSRPPPPPRQSQSGSCPATRDGCYLCVPRRCPASFRCGIGFIGYHVTEPRHMPHSKPRTS